MACARGGCGHCGANAQREADLVHVEAEKRVVDDGSVALSGCGIGRLVALFLSSAFAALFAA